MKKKHLKHLMALGAAMLTIGMATAQNTNPCSVGTLPWSTSFADSAQRACWTVLGGSDGWSLSTEGRNDSTAMTSDDEEALLVSPAVTVPTAYVSLDYWVSGTNIYGFIASSYMVLVSTTGDTAAACFTDTLTVDQQGNTEYANRTVSLAAYAGRTVHVAFKPVSSGFGGALAVTIDDVTVRQALAPRFSLQGPTRTLTGDTAVFAATRIEGDTAGLTYTWRTHLQSTIVATGAQAKIVYQAAGTDTVTFIARNSHGTDSLTAEVNVINCTAVSTFPYAEDFEGETDCWRFVSGNGQEIDDWEGYSQSGLGHDGSNRFLLGYYSQEQADEWAISPAFVIPSPANGLAFSYYVAGGSRGGHPAVYELRASTGSADTATFADTLLTDTLSSSSYVKRVIDLSRYAGRTVRFAFHNTTAANGPYMLIDDIEVRRAGRPEWSVSSPATAFVGDTALLTATRVDGLTDGLRLTWHSAMAADGQATLVADSIQMKIVYRTAGTDTVTFVAHNTMGDDTVVSTLRVVDCSPIATFPYEEDFEGETDCWTYVSGNGQSNDDWEVYSQANLGHNNSSHFLLGYYSSEQADEWAVSPAFVIPSPANGLAFSYYVSAGRRNGQPAVYELRASTSGADTAAFADTLLADTVSSSSYVKRTIDLTRYAGQTVRFAFHNTTAANGPYMIIDDISLHSANLPVYHIEGPAEAEAYEPVVLHAVHEEGDTAETHMNWSSAIGARIVAAADSAVLTYSAAGTDTVTLTVANHYGTSTSTFVVSISHCDTISLFPYTEDFEDSTASTDCWSFTSGNPAHSSFWYILDYYGRGEGKCLRQTFSFSNDTLDDYAISPAYTLPTDAESLRLQYYVNTLSRGQVDSLDSVSTRYQIMISTSGTAIEDFVPLLEESVATEDYAERNIDLADYAGRTVRLAIHNISTGDGSPLMFDDISILTTRDSSESILRATASQLALYPNPAHETAVIRLDGLEGHATVSLYDLGGRLLRTQPMEAAEMRLGLEGLPQGTYFVRVVSSTASATAKLIIR